MRAEDINTFEQVSESDWDDLVRKSPNASPFHLQSFLQVWSQTFGYKPLYLVARHADSIVAGLPLLERRSSSRLIRNYYSLCDGFYGSIIARPEAPPQVAEAILKHFLQILKGWRAGGAVVVDFNGGSPLLAERAANVRHAFAHILELDRPLSALYGNYDYSIKKNLRKASRSNVVVRDIQTADEIALYYDMTLATAKKYGRPPYPRELFANVYDMMVPRGHARFTLAFRGEQPLAGALHLLTDRHVFNWLTVAYPEYLEFRPVEAVISSSIEWAATKGATVYNFGATPPESPGVIRFKEKWGTQKRVYNMYEINCRSRVSGAIARLEGLLTNVARSSRNVIGGQVGVESASSLEPGHSTVRRLREVRREASSVW